MNKKLNLIGIKQLRLVEDINGKKFNSSWVNQQLVNNGFILKSSKLSQDILCTKPIISMMASYTNDEDKLLNVVTLDKLVDFPNTKSEIELEGDELDGDGIKNAILDLIPSVQNLQEADEDTIILPSQSMENLTQFENMMSYLKKSFNVKIDTKDDTGITYILTLNKPLFKVKIEDNLLGMKVYNQPRFKSYDSLETIFNIIAKNLGIDDLTSQLWIEDTNQQQNTQEEQNQEDEQQDNQEVEKEKFSRNVDLDDEEIALRKQLSPEVNQILNAKNETLDTKNLSTWSTAYSRCKDLKEKDIFLELFFNKKVNVPTKIINNNITALSSIFDNRGFDANKNPSINFVDNWNTKVGKEMNPGVIMVLISLINNQSLTSGNDELIYTDSLLYEPNIYENVKVNSNNIIEALSIYIKIYKMGRVPEDIVKQMSEDYDFITETKSPQELAEQIVYDSNSKQLRDINEIRYLYEQLTGESFEAVDNSIDKKSINDLKKSIENKKIPDVTTLDKEAGKVLTQALNKVISSDNRVLKLVSDNVTNSSSD